MRTGACTFRISRQNLQKRVGVLEEMLEWEEIRVSSALLFNYFRRAQTFLSKVSIVDWTDTNKTLLAILFQRKITPVHGNHKKSAQRIHSSANDQSLPHALLQIVNLKIFACKRACIISAFQQCERVYDICYAIQLYLYDAWFVEQGCYFSFLKTCS